MNDFAQEWNALTKMELSKAVKCPNIATFLTGMKKVQEYLTYEENLQELCGNDNLLVNSFRSVFANFLSLNDQVFTYFTTEILKK